MNPKPESQHCLYREMVVVHSDTNFLDDITGSLGEVPSSSISWWRKFFFPVIVLTPNKLLVVLYLENSFQQSDA